MNADSKLVTKAVEIFRSKKLRSDDVEGAALLLEGFGPFDEMDDAELKGYVNAALAQMGGTGEGRRATSPDTTTARGKPRSMPDYTSPFVFVTLSDAVAEASGQAPVDIPIKDGFCATILYE